MDLELAGKTALVTGSSRGIGRAIAEALRVEGCKVVLNARHPDELNATAVALQSPAIAGDVTRADEARRVVDEAVGLLGQLDILVCNVGSGRSVAPGTETPEEWQRVFAINLWSAIHMVEAARGALATSRGAVVCISSICGLEVVPGAPVTYSVAKAALHAYVRGIARPLGAQGVRINAIAPGNILFDGSVWQKKLAADAAGVQAMLETNVPLQRLGTPREIGELAAYLASPRSGFATGSIWTLDGGQVRA
ncbi:MULTISPECIES: SDR family oxidoreductase [unclassified Polaromonas]|jgi:NAD(P)-dependent dehydrogenase (short-subunit alcohol dehydrogenase family)|uniref:SDR family NAD(P)-dependent oxidoreductase n=1 Tax=unclassified Polaromonas TaxID=2638319 RepID=UPI000BD82697|nr:MULTISPECIES: SDR family oxidoreductase [unclassified Polaromonas]OYY39793.1 MAG: oxidoreductase [Polaromonas sp. 35-63-35]OYZ22538.1 MAG: oxidoreductase [Polaromonas sp. 16-63-31]OYZ81246.1 MAG: oxidoreductase [Polaromonas sp. 24-63-21]OZA52533.1 MAG: oxidoreductase [Polaromonas sp. 17-63-33]OZA88607.1 MAG: oxidoreductase [Polaromonas sp. 39-63-25]